MPVPPAPTDSPRKAVPSSSHRNPSHDSCTSRPAAIVARTQALSILADQPGVLRPALEAVLGHLPAGLRVEQDEVRRGSDGNLRRRPARTPAPGPPDMRSSSVSSETEPRGRRGACRGPRTQSPGPSRRTEHPGTAAPSRAAHVALVGGDEGVVPSRTASMSALRSSSVRRGGLIFAFGSTSAPPRPSASRVVRCRPRRSPRMPIGTRRASASTDCFTDSPCSARPLLVGRERHVARDDRTLGDRGPAGRPELCRDDALVHVTRRAGVVLLAVDGERGGR